MPQTLGFLILGLLPNAAFAGLVGAIGFTGVGTLALGLGLGALYGLAMLIPQEKPPTPQPSDVQANIRQEISPRRRIYDRYLTGSVIVFGFRRGEKTYVLHYIGEGPIGGYVSFRLDKKPVTLDASGFVQEAQYIVDGRSRVQLLTTLGAMTDEPFANLLAAFPELDTPLTPFRHRGCAMVLQIVEQVPSEDLQDVYPNNLPGLQVLIDGFARVYDPRNGTYGVSGNAGSCLLTELMDVYGYTAASSDWVDFDSFADFADHSDETVPLKAGGTEKRWRCAGVLQLNAENEARIQEISKICNADVYIDAQGRWAVRAKMRETPAIALRFRNGDHFDVQLEGGRGLQKQFNTALVTYVDPALNYKSNEVRWRHPDLYEEDGTEFTQPVSALLCPSATQAMRIAKLAVFENNPEFVGSLVSGPQGLDLLDDYVFTLDLSPEDDFERVACATGAIEFDQENMTVSASLAIMRAGANDWEPSIDEQIDVVVPPVLPSYVDDVALDVVVTVQLQSNSAPVLHFAFDAAGAATLPDSYSHQVEVSPAGAEEWSAAVVTQRSNTALFGPVADGGSYDWRIRNIASGRTFDWQYSTTPVTVIVDATPPIALASFSAAGTAPYLGGVALTFTTANDAHLHTVKIYRKASGSPLNLATDASIAGPFYVGPQSTYGHADGDLTRTDMVTNGAFASDTAWAKGAGWTISGGKATKATGSNSAITQALVLTGGALYRYGFSVPNLAVAGFRFRLEGSTLVNGLLASTTGNFQGTVTANGTSTGVGVNAAGTVDGSIDELHLYLSSLSCAPQGVWDYYAVPFNVSGIPGPALALSSVRVI